MTINKLKLPSSRKISQSLIEEKPFEALRIIVAIFIALGIILAVLFFVSPTPINDFARLLTYPLQKKFYFGYVLIKMIPLCFAGLATLLYFRTSLFNLSTEGVFYFSGIVCTYFAINSTFMTGNGLIDSFICILVAGLSGGIIALFPGWLNAKFQTDELVISLMLNSILYGFGFWLMKTFMADTSVSGNASLPFLPSTRLSTIISGTQVHSGLIIMFAMVIFVYILLFKTKLGYQLRITGLNSKFAKYSGMSAFGLFMVVHFIAGFIGGVGSSVELLGMYPQFSWAVLPGLGFTGALMAMLGKNHPIGVLIAAFGISYLRASAQLLANSAPYIDVKMISIVEVVLTLLISSRFFLQAWRERQLLKEEKQHG